MPDTPSKSRISNAEVHGGNTKIASQRTSAITYENGRTAMFHRQGLGQALIGGGPHNPPASPMELPQTQRWALLHPTRSKHVALAQTAAEHNEMLGAAQRRAEQHLVDVRRRLRTLSD